MKKGLGESRGLFRAAWLGHDAVMPDTPFDLTEKEVVVLNLLARGHDVKSAAVELGLSVHTVHERLREARRKTGASSSRGAARLLTEAAAPDFSGPQKSGVSVAPIVDHASAQPRLGASDGLRFWGRWGAPVMISAATTVTILAAAHIGSGGAIKPVDAPRVVSTRPAAGTVVPAGPVGLTITFDRPMRHGSYSFVYVSPDTYPECGNHAPVQSADGRTFTLACSVRSGKSYEVWLNSPDYRNFMSEDGISAPPYQLKFRAK